MASVIVKVMKSKQLYYENRGNIISSSAFGGNMEQYDTTPVEINNGCETIGELECLLERLVGDIMARLRPLEEGLEALQNHELRQRGRYLEYIDQLDEKVDKLSKRVAELEYQKTANENNQDDPEWY